MQYFITGTDTDVGKTVAAAWMMLQLGASYWKPVQAGVEEETDEQVVRRLTGFSDSYFWPSTYSLREPLSPHEAARREGATIEMEHFELPKTDDPLIVEGAGGVLVPLNDKALVIDLIAQLGLPVILVARSGLGTINHTLLSLEALRRRNLEVAGVVLNGERQTHNLEAIETYGDIPVLAEITPLSPLTKAGLLGINPLIDFKSGNITR